jgi:hypothetical protein
MAKTFKVGINQTIKVAKFRRGAGAENSLGAPVT